MSSGLHRTWRRRTGVVAAGVALALALAGCAGPGGGQEGTTQGAKDGGILRIATSSGINALNPFVGINQDDYSVWTYIYPHLLYYDTTSPGYDYIGGFAKSWSTSPDGLTITFQTVPDAKWSDGSPLTAADVAWTFDLLKKHADGILSGSAQVVEFLESMTATDANTVVATYTKPIATALYDLGTTPILPRKVWEQHAAGDGKALKTFANVPKDGEPVVSGGPFMLTKYKKNDIALFTRNPHWYGAKPHIDGFGLQYFTSEDAMVTALKTGQVDAIEQIPPTSVSGLEAAGMNVYKGPALSLRDFIINSNPDKKKNRELLNPRVREALEHATNRAAIVDTAWLGHATPGTSIIPAGSASGGVEWHNPTIEATPYDPAKANELLDSLGYTRGPDGTRVADGHPMSYEVIFAKDEAGAGTRAFQILQKDFAEIGIKISQNELDANAAWDAIYCEEDCEYAHFDFAMWDWFPAADPDFILAAMTCDQWGNWNDAGYCDEKYDELYEQQRHALDPKERQKIVWEMQQMIYDARPYLILTYDKRLDAWSPKWDGFVESVQGLFNNFSVQSLLSVHQK